MEIVILDQLTKNGKYLVIPEKGIYENQHFEYGIVKNPSSDFKTIANEYFASRMATNEIESKYDYYVLKLFHGDGRVGEKYKENADYFTKEEISDNIDDLYAVITWSKEKNSWNLSWKNNKGVWSDETL